MLVNRVICRYEDGTEAVVEQHLAGYLRCLWSLFWSAIRHPLTETVIDWQTGRIVR